ncbi:MAG TPA: Hsp20/alpha crystallin family protein [Thermomicrobiales bacterium]|nr:Hsp20/alpha crystallin family protein [Thermomicrobiales bacterium]
MIVIRRGRPRPATRKSNEVDEVVRALMSGQRSVGMRSFQTWRPMLDVYSTGDAFEVVAELAGMRGDDIDVLIEGDVLVISGVRERPAADNCLSYYEARIPFGPFRAEVVVPFEIDWEATTADYTNGFLTVSLPRRQPHAVPVRRRDSADEAEESEIDS